MVLAIGDLAGATVVTALRVMHSPRSGLSPILTLPLGGLGHPNLRPQGLIHKPSECGHTGAS
jgi:hypothetical protein